MPVHQISGFVPHVSAKLSQNYVPVVLVHIQVALTNQYIKFYEEKSNSYFWVLLDEISFTRY